MDTVIARREPDLQFDFNNAEEWHRRMLADGLLVVWVLHYDAPGYPGTWHARPCTVPAHGNGLNLETLTYNAVLLAPTLQALRGLLPVGMYRIPREKSDEWTVIETWQS